MARRKNSKKNKEKSRADAAKSPIAALAGPEKAQADSPQKTIQPQNDAEKGKTPRMARISTCVAGMFLTFIFGLYLGSLLPGVAQDLLLAQKGSPRQNSAAIQNRIAMEKETRPESGASQESAAKPAQSSRPQKAELPPIPDSMAQRIADLEGIVSNQATNAAALIELGNLYFDTNQPEKSIKSYESALALAPDNADVLTDLGIMYRETGDFNKALECFRKAMKINPRHENAMFNAGVVLFTDMGRKDEARAEWENLLRLNPHARAPDGKTLSEMINNIK